MNLYRILSCAMSFILSVSCSGCSVISYSHFDRIIKENPTLSPKDLAIKLEENPIKSVSIQDSITYQIYELPLDDYNAIVYFKNDKIACYGQYEAFNILECQRSLNIIDEEEYRFKYKVIQDKKLALQEQELREKELEYQRQSLEYQKQNAYNQRRMADSLDSIRTGGKQPIILPANW